MAIEAVSFQVLGVIAAAAVKSSVALAAAIAADGLWSRRDAALCHRTWLVAVAGTLVLAPLQMALPAIRLHVITDRTYVVSAAAGPGIWTALAVLYAAVGLALLARVGLGWRAIARVMHEAEDVDAGDRSRFGALSGVRVVTHPAIAVPLTMGVRRPMIALPESWHSWSGDEAAAVLAHEHAHILRHDTRAAVAARVVVACFWFNPLMWLALRRLTALAEFAADEDAARVAGPRRYARHLLAVAADAPAGPRLELATGAGSNLEARIEALLEAGRTGFRDRRGPALLPALLGAALLVAGLFTVSMEAGPGWMDDHAASHAVRHGRH